MLTTEGALREGGLWCFAAGREFACTSQSDFRALGLSLSEAVLDEVATACDLWDARSTLGGNRIVRCHKPADLHQIRSRLITLSKDFRNSQASLGNPQQLHKLELDVTRQILESLQGPLEVIATPMTHRRQLVLRRTLEYLEAYPDSPLTVYELAQVVRAGVRTLEYVFKEYFDLSPKAYLTNRRLVGARRELQCAEAATTHVGDVALRWRFSYPGRFSMTYRRFFGEAPSQTLKRR